MEQYPLEPRGVEHSEELEQNMQDPMHTSIGWSSMLGIVLPGATAGGAAYLGSVFPGAAGASLDAEGGLLQLVSGTL